MQPNVFIEQYITAGVPALAVIILEIAAASETMYLLVTRRKTSIKLYPHNYSLALFTPRQCPEPWMVGAYADDQVSEYTTEARHPTLSTDHDCYSGSGLLGRD